MSRVNASFSRLQLSVFDGSGARKLGFHKLKWQFNCEHFAAMSFAVVFYVFGTFHFPFQ